MTLTLAEWAKGLTKKARKQTILTDEEIRESYRYLAHCQSKVAIGWFKFLQRFPLSYTKTQLVLKRKDDSFAMGIFCDHLISMASKLGIPKVYLRDIRYYQNRTKRRPKNDPIKGTLIGKTNQLLAAVNEML